jgi:hypothetical protein
MLGVAEPLSWRMDGPASLVIGLPEALQEPARRPCRQAWAFRIEGTPVTP